MFIVIPSGQEGGNYRFELIPRSFEKVEAANGNQVKTEHKEILVGRLIIPEKSLQKKIFKLLTWPYPLLAPQSGALRISAYRDFQSHPTLPLIAFEHLSLSMVI